jgi:multiple sugar transport system permease protein/putative aldouronate transport system permease protein
MKLFAQHKNKSAFDSVFYVANNIFLLMFMIVCLYPLLYVLSSSLSSPTAVLTGKVRLWPVDFGFKGYITVFKNMSVYTGYTNSIIYTAIGTLLNVSMTLMTAYPLSRRELVGRMAISFMLAFTMWFNGGMIPTYILMKNMNFINTRMAMWFPGMVSVWNVIITRTYFKTTIPDELFESASLDGCTYGKYFIYVVLPLSGAIIAVISLFSAVGHWNAYFNAFLYLNNEKLYPLQVILRNILLQNAVTTDSLASLRSDASEAGLQELLKYSLIMVACIPVWCAYPFVQKFFVRGVMVGSIKG